MPKFSGGICNKDCPTCTNLSKPSFNNTYTSLDLKVEITDEVLGFRSSLLLKKAVPSILEKYTSTFTTTVLASDSSIIASIDPICSDDFCSFHGNCTIISKFLACKCFSGYAGSNCHIVNNDYEYMKDEFSKLI